MSTDERPRVLLVAQNVSRFMGGESIKALEILEGYQRMGFDVTQVTHARVREELSAYRTDLDIVYVEDGPVQVWSYKLGLRFILDTVGSWLLNRKTQQMIDQKRPWIVHVTSPISPTVPSFRLRGAPVVIGPLNGNLLHPPALMFRESRAKVLSAKLMVPVQWVSRLVFRGKLKARLLISGGERTVDALLIGGCRREQMVHTLDSGVSDMLCARPRLPHEGVNQRFLFMGRLVAYKGCDLVIRALKDAPDAYLDVIGDGALRADLQALAEREGVADRVHFLGWIPSGPALFEQLEQYRAFLFPTLAEANGIVIQEAMVLGLPIVTVNWGGPALLLDDETAIMIEPDSEAAIVAGVAEAMRSLGQDAGRAERLSRAARARTEEAGFAWSSLLRNWAGLYDAYLAEQGAPQRFAPWIASRD